MKWILILITATLLIWTPYGVKTYAAEIVEGTYVSQIDGIVYTFHADGSYTMNGQDGMYSISGDVLTLMIEGHAKKYSYEYIGDMLILYDSNGNGTVFDKQLEVENQPSPVEAGTQPIQQRATANIDFDELSKSVLLLNCYDKDDELAGTASGFVAFDGTTIVTNYHVIDGMCKIIGTNEYGKEIEINDVLNYDIEKDIAILTVPEDTGLSPLTFGDSSMVNKGDEVYTIGSPQGLINTVSSGLLSGEISLGNQLYLQISAPTSQGSSGGVLLNNEGLVIGVTAAGMNEGQNLNFAVPINDVKETYNTSTTKMTLYECAEKENPTSLLSALSVKSGDIIVKPYEECKYSLTVSTSGDQVFYVYLKKNNVRIISFLINGGDTITLKVPEGYYNVYYGYGKKWYGKDELFADSGKYFKIDGDQLVLRDINSQDLLDLYLPGSSSAELFLTSEYFVDGHIEISKTSFQMGW